MSPILLEARGLTRNFRIGPWHARKRTLQAVAEVDLVLAPGDALGIVGESGCGKSTLGRLLLGLLEPTLGEIRFDGAPLPPAATPAWRALRRRAQLVPQDPLAALDPRMPIGAQIVEPLRIHGVETDRGNLRRAALAALEAIGLGADLVDRLPHQISGGQRQRVVIGRALALRPVLIVFDEPVSALDVSVQAQIISLVRETRARHGLAHVFISHDLRVVRQVSDRVAVMYLGRIVETGPAATIFAAPRHPYTRALLAAVPGLAPAADRPRARLQGEAPSPLAPPPGCAFHPRCAEARALCRVTRPRLEAVDGGHAVACHADSGFRRPSDKETDPCA
jgi:peptide/nickel transport system ATP-binding protein